MKVRRRRSNGKQVPVACVADRDKSGGWVVAQGLPTNEWFDSGMFSRDWGTCGSKASWGSRGGNEEECWWVAAPGIGRGLFM